LSPSIICGVKVNLDAEGMLAPPQLAASLNKRGGGPTTTTPTLSNQRTASSSTSSSSTSSSAASSTITTTLSASTTSLGPLHPITTTSAASATSTTCCYPPLNLANQNNNFQIKSNNFHDYRAADSVLLVNRNNSSGKVCDLNSIIEDNIINDFEKLQVEINKNILSSSATSLLDINNQYQQGNKFIINTDLTATMLMDKAKQKCKY
jgi:hypothetical protein